MTQAFNLGALYDARTGGDGIALIDVLDWDNPRTYSHREIDDAANGRLGVGRDLDQIHAQTAGGAKGILDAHHAELLVVDAVDHAHLAGADAFVDADIS